MGVDESRMKMMGYDKPPPFCEGNGFLDERNDLFCEGNGFLNGRKDLFCEGDDFLNGRNDLFWTEMIF